MNSNRNARQRRRRGLSRSQQAGNSQVALSNDAASSNHTDSSNQNNANSAVNSSCPLPAQPLTVKTATSTVVAAISSASTPVPVSISAKKPKLKPFVMNHEYQKRRLRKSDWQKKKMVLAKFKCPFE